MNNTHPLIVFVLVVTSIASLGGGRVAPATAEETVGDHGNVQAVVDTFQGSMSKEWRWLRENKDGWKLTDGSVPFIPLSKIISTR